MSATIFLLHHRTKLLVLSNSNVLKHHCNAKLKTASNASSKWWLRWWSTASWSKQQQPIGYNSYHYFHSKNHNCSFLLHNYHLQRQSSRLPEKDRNRNFCSNSSSDSSGKGKLVAFNLSDIGEGIGEVTIKEWFVKVGDHVKQFDNICEVQSDKASVTITSRFDGIIKKIYYKVDDLAKVGEPLVDILIDDENDAAEEGSTEDQTESLAEEETPRANDHESETTKTMEKDYLGSGKILITPAVRRMALEHKIHLDQVKGTGKDGRIMKEDMLNYINNINKTAAQSSQPMVSSQQQSPKPVTSEPRKPIAPSSIPPAPKPVPLKEDRVEPMTSVMKGMFKTMTKSLNVPHFGLSDEIDMTNLVEMKAEIKKISLEKGVPLSFMPFFIKAASLSLNEYPILNSTIQEDGEKIIYKSSHNIGVAMDTKQGLLVPNIKHVNQMTLLEIAQELQRLQQLAQKGQLGVKDLTGGTFTLSNIGSIGGLFGIPVLMPGEVVIGAIGKTRQLPRFADNSTTDQIKRAHIVQVLWSADHRIIDGATMTRFCQTWKQYLENPLRIFIC